VTCHQVTKLSLITGRCSTVAAGRRRVLCGDADSERLGQHAFMGPMIRSLMGPGLRKWIAESIAETSIAETDDASPIAESIAETDDASPIAETDDAPKNGGRHCLRSRRRPCA
jgi:hypothetical protein